MKFFRKWKQFWCLHIWKVDNSSDHPLAWLPSIGGQYVPYICVRCGKKVLARREPISYYVDRL